jgi:hypothetical protein
MESKEIESASSAVPAADSQQDTPPPAGAATPAEEKKITLLERVLAQAKAKPASDPDADPPRIAHVSFTRRQLLKVLKPQLGKNKRADALFAGVSNAGERSVISVVREHLLIALGELTEEDDDE